MLVPVTGGRLDVSPDIVKNMSFNSLVSGDKLTGTNSTGQPSGIGMLNDWQQPPQMGDWFPVDSSTFIGHPGDAINGNVNMEWALPGRRQSLLPGEWDGDSDWRDVFIADNFTYHNTRVKVTKRTLAGLVELGYLTKDQANSINGGVIPDPPKPVATPPTPGAVVQSSFNALVVLAVLGVAVWFLPKNILRGGA